jgi:hypothetical protein
VVEDPLAQAQRQVHEFEQLVDEQIGRLARMKADGDSKREMENAETVLATMQVSLELAREHLAFEREQSQRQRND